MNIKLKYREILLVRKVSSNESAVHGYTFVDFNKKDKAVAAYNDFLTSLMPEVLYPNSKPTQVFICDITQYLLSLEVVVEEIDLKQEMQFSINPNSFLPLRRMHS